MQILLVAVLMMFFVGVGLLKSEQIDPTNNQNIASVVANAIAENAFLYINTAKQYAVDSKSYKLDAIPILDKNLNVYMLDENQQNIPSQNGKAAFVFRLLNDHNAYAVGIKQSSQTSNNRYYVLISWNPLNHDSGYYPLGISQDINKYNYTTINGGVMGGIAMLVSRQSGVDRKPYIIGDAGDDSAKRCDDKSSFKIYETIPIPAAKIDEYKDTYVRLCKTIEQSTLPTKIGQYVIFQEIINNES